METEPETGTATQTETRTKSEAATATKTGTKTGTTTGTKTEMGTETEQTPEDSLTLTEHTLASHLALLAAAKTDAVVGASIYHATVRRLDFLQQYTTNLALSPLLMDCALAMMYSGVRGNTAAQMKAVFRYPEEEDLVHQSMGVALAYLRRCTRFALSADTMLCALDGLQLRDEFAQMATSRYGARLRQSDRADACRDINEWAKEATRGKVADIVKEEDLQSGVRLCLFNVVYIKGIWANSFSSTSAGVFRTLQGLAVSVPLMRYSGSLNGTFCWQMDCGVVEVPFGGGRTVMLVFLPTNENGLAFAEQKLTTVDIHDLVDRMHKSVYHLVLPRFKVDFCLDVCRVLSSVGLGDLFDADEVDLEDIVGKKGVAPDVFLHRVVVEVNEEAVAEEPEQVSQVQASQFVCTRPFLFAIFDKLTGLVIVRGRVVDPSS